MSISRPRKRIMIMLEEGFIFEKISSGSDVYTNRLSPAFFENFYAGSTEDLTWQYQINENLDGLKRIYKVLKDFRRQELANLSNYFSNFLKKEHLYRTVFPFTSNLFFC